MKLAFLIPNMKHGGAEKVVQNILNEMLIQKPDFKVHLILAKKEGDLLFHLNKNIKIIDFKKKHVKNCLFDLIKYLKDEKPDYLISSLDYMNIIASFAHKLSNSNSKLILWEHSILSIHSKKTISKFIFFNKVLVRVFYNRANKIIAVSKGIKKDLIKKFRISCEKVVVIYNPVYNSKIILESNKKEEMINFKQKYIVALGRLVKEKNYFNLIESYKKLIDLDGVSNLDLVIIGEGPERQNIIRKITELNLNNNVFLIGYRPNPFPIIKQSLVFVLSSDYEGFGLGIIEALALKKQIVSTDCPTGPREILSGGKFGILVPKNNPVELAKGIQKIINGRIKFNEELLLKRAQNFSIKNFFNSFITLFKLN